MGRLEKMKRLIIEEANKRILKEYDVVIERPRVIDISDLDNDLYQKTDISHVYYHKNPNRDRSGELIDYEDKEIIAKIPSGLTDEEVVEWMRKNIKTLKQKRGK